MSNIIESQSYEKLPNSLHGMIDFMNFDKEITARSKPYVTISDIVKILLNTNITWRPDMAPRCRYSQELSETSSLVNTLHVCLHVCDPAVLIQFTYPHVCFNSVHVCDTYVWHVSLLRLFCLRVCMRVWDVHSLPNLLSLSITYINLGLLLDEE